MTALSELCTNTSSMQGNSIFYVGNGITSQFTNSLIIQNAISDDMTDEQVKERLESLIKDLTQLLDLIGKRNLQNEQWCLDGLDEINNQSVRY